MESASIEVDRSSLALSFSEAEDTDGLERASRERRTLLTHDVSPMSAHAYKRIRAGQSTAELIEVPQSRPIGQAIEHILTIAECGTAAELKKSSAMLATATSQGQPEATFGAWDVPTSPLAFTCCPSRCAPGLMRSSSGRHRRCMLAR